MKVKLNVSNMHKERVHSPMVADCSGSKVSSVNLSSKLQGQIHLYNYNLPGSGLKKEVTVVPTTRTGANSTDFIEERRL